MNSEKEKTMTQGDHKNSSSQEKPETNQESAPKRPDYKADSQKSSSGTSQPQFDKINSPDDRNKKDAAPEHYLNEQAIDPKEFTKKETHNSSVKSDRI